MANTNYITLAQVKQRMRSNYTGADDVALQEILNSAAAFLDTYCNRSPGGFLTQSYDIMFDGTGEELYFTPDIPIQSISRLSTVPQPVLSVLNTDTDQGSRALIASTSTGLTLTYIKNAVTHTNTITWASCPMVQDIVAAINLIGLNWTANVQGGFGTWASTDIRPTQGAFGARPSTAYLWILWQDVFWYRVNESTGEIWNPACFVRGMFNFRLGYTAGYTSFPADLAQVLAELTVGAYYIREANSNMQTESLDGAYSYTRLVTQTFDGLSDVSKHCINRYKIRRISKFSTW